MEPNLLERFELDPRNREQLSDSRASGLTSWVTRSCSVTSAAITAYAIDHHHHAFLKGTTAKAL